MTKDEIKFIISEFLESNFNKALSISVILSLIVFVIIPWGIPVLILLWLIFLYRFKGFRELYPNRSYLIFFSIISFMLSIFYTSFFWAIPVFIFALFIPEDKWSFLKKD